MGHVVSVSGSRISGLLQVPPAGVEAPPVPVQVGSVVKVETPGSTAFGLIASMKIENPSFPPSEHERRFFEMELLGESLIEPDTGEHLPFQRGVSSYPALGAAVFAATRDDLARVYARPMTSNVRIGSVYQDRTLPAFLTTDQLLGKHFAVLGTTGVGKSCTVALILRAILDQNPNGHVVLLDPHAEYARAFGKMAEVIDPHTLQLPYWLLDFEETTQVLIGPDAQYREAERSTLKAAIVEAKRKYVGDTADALHLTVDTPVPYRLDSVLRYIDDAMGRLNKTETSSAPYMRLKARIEGLRADRRYDFMFSSMFLQDSMAEILSRLLRIPVAGRPITICDLSGVPSEIVDVVVSMLCRMIFDFALWSDRQTAVPVLLVCEEAHRYVPGDQSIGFAATRRAIARIAKEGRKYGVSLCLVSQRPSELSASVLSQCNTLFALRMTNQPDQEFVAKALPDSALGLLHALPALRTQEAIVVGEGVSVPVRLRFEHLDEELRPRSGTASFARAWQTDTDRRSALEETIERWRRQERDSGGQ